MVFLESAPRARLGSRYGGKKQTQGDRSRYGDEKQIQGDRAAPLRERASVERAVPPEAR